MKDGRGAYIPAFSYDWLTPLYDPVVGGLLRDARFKRRLVRQARVQPGYRVLDLGCGTATLTILIKKRHPDAEVIGIDGDPKILRIARSKVARAGPELTLDQGMAFDLPYPDAHFDRVFSSLVFHHLATENKRGACREVSRVLRPGGELHVADFGRPHNPLMYLVSLVVRRFEQVADNIDGRLPGMFREAGLVDVRETTRYATPFGTLALYRAAKPVAGEPSARWGHPQDRLRTGSASSRSFLMDEAQRRPRNPCSSEEPDMIGRSLT